MNLTFIEYAIKKNLGQLSPHGALMVKTGASTGRSTKERFVVAWEDLKNEIDWGVINQPIDPVQSEDFFKKLQTHLESEETFRMNGFVGCFPIQVFSRSPWHIAFCQNMFRETPVDSLASQVQSDAVISIFHAPHLTMKDLGIKWPFEKAIIVDFKNLKVGIIGTAYAGEIKKSAFSVCNFLFPKHGIMPMHASSNCNQKGGQSSVLFGLSGTGKTTLSADPERFLIGDDEIIWSAEGLSNLEGGCYAKLINLDPEKEPEIYKATCQPGSILENVVYHSETRMIDFSDRSITENTRGSYSLKSLDQVFNQSREAEPPRSLVFLTADAFGALPAIARLDDWQAQYHFISGYTAKVAGTEMGVLQPEVAFSSCFGAPFMPRPPKVYAELLAKLIQKYNVKVWLLNTGWIDGFKNNDQRFPIPVSRRMLTLIQSGELDSVPMVTHPLFGFQVPKEISGVDARWLKIPQGDHVKELAEKFMKNAELKSNSFTDEIILKGGPKV